MGTVIRFPTELLRLDWEEVFQHECTINGTVLHVYLDKRTGAVDVVQMNSDGESITTHLGPFAGESFRKAISGSR